MQILHKALIFAADAHREVGQTRKYSDDPYIVHPIEVMGFLVAYASPRFRTEDVLASAILHDTVEDTKVTLDEINQHFGPRVARFVDGLSDKYVAGYIEDGETKPANRKRRKFLERERLRTEPDEVLTVKCADLRSNTGSIVRFDPGFAKTYIPEKRAILEVIRDTGRADPAMFDLAWNALLDAEKALGL